MSISLQAKKPNKQMDRLPPGMTSRTYIQYHVPNNEYSRLIVAEAEYTHEISNAFHRTHMFV